MLSYFFWLRPFKNQSNTEYGLLYTKQVKQFNLKKNNAKIICFSRLANEGIVFSEQYFAFIFTNNSI